MAVAGHRVRLARGVARPRGPRVSNTGLVMAPFLSCGCW